MSSRPRVLFVDAYDSFTNNIVALLEKNFDAEVTIVKVDADIKCLATFLEPFLAVVLGPGPGDPRNPEDVGLFSRFWRLPDEHLRPALGICLGFQSLVLNFGGSVHRLPQPRHGIVRTVRAVTDVADNIIPDSIRTVQYHSLHATISKENAKDGSLIEMAWDRQIDNGSVDQPEYDLNPASILMAVRHGEKPFFGIQFHAESICSDEDARNVVFSWFRGVLERRSKWKAESTSNQTGQIQVAVKETFSPEIGVTDYEETLKDGFGLDGLDDEASKKPCEAQSSSNEARSKSPSSYQAHHCRTIPFSNLTVPAIMSKLKLADDQMILLDSENHQRADVGRFSILGIVNADSLRFEYHVGSRCMYKSENGRSDRIDFGENSASNVFDFLKLLMGQHRVAHGPAMIPFWGGLVGYISYEACLETINIAPPTAQAPDQTHTRPDLSFVYVERSIVISHLTKELYVQTSRSNDQNWVNSTAFVLKNTPPSTPVIDASLRLDSDIQIPSRDGYQQAVRNCKEHISAGDSYELCFTNSAIIHTAKQENAWLLYLRLRQINPAPFSAYFRAGRLTLLSSSPERFLSWTRPEIGRSNDGLQSMCQFRPIKGTISRQPRPDVPSITLAEAERLLATAKEKAENLMIVDLIRHDLHGVVGARNVNVPKLMVVEEYETLFQLVSVIEGNLRGPRPSMIAPKSKETHAICEATTQPGVASSVQDDTAQIRNALQNTKTGVDVLAASLPPGSMTGAPKKRSCQLLQKLEGRPRGIYSGIFGYLDAGGGGDFSVVIRSTFRWNDPHEEGEGGVNRDDAQTNKRSSDRDTWTIGAGGAITALSTEEGEYEEMLAKLRSTIRLFEDETTTYSSQH